MKINIPFNIKITKDENIFIVHSKTYFITGYGKTKKAALKSFDITLKAILYHTKPKTIKKKK